MASPRSPGTPSRGPPDRRHLKGVKLQQALDALDLDGNVFEPKGMSPNTVRRPREDMAVNPSDEGARRPIMRATEVENRDVPQQIIPQQITLAETHPFYRQPSGHNMQSNLIEPVPALVSPRASERSLGHAEPPSPTAVRHGMQRLGDQDRSEPRYYTSAGGQSVRLSTAPPIPPRQRDHNEVPAPLTPRRRAPQAPHVPSGSGLDSPSDREGHNTPSEFTQTRIRPPTFNLSPLAHRGKSATTTMTSPTTFDSPPHLTSMMNPMASDGPPNLASVAKPMMSENHGQLAPAAEPTVPEKPAEPAPVAEPTVPDNQAKHASMAEPTVSDKPAQLAHTGEPTVFEKATGISSAAEVGVSDNPTPLASMVDPSVSEDTAQLADPAVSKDPTQLTSTAAPTTSHKKRTKQPPIIIPSLALTPERKDKLLVKSGNAFAGERDELEPEPEEAVWLPPDWNGKPTYRGPPEFVEQARARGEPDIEIEERDPIPSALALVSAGLMEPYDPNVVFVPKVVFPPCADLDTGDLEAGLAEQILEEDPTTLDAESALNSPSAADDGAAGDDGDSEWEDEEDDEDGEDDDKGSNRGWTHLTFDRVPLRPLRPDEMEGWDEDDKDSDGSDEDEDDEWEDYDDDDSDDDDDDGEDGKEDFFGVSKREANKMIDSLLDFYTPMTRLLNFPPGHEFAEKRPKTSRRASRDDNSSRRKQAPESSASKSASGQSSGRLSRMRGEIAKAFNGKPPGDPSVSASHAPASILSTVSETTAGEPHEHEKTDFRGSTDGGEAHEQTWI